MKLNTTAKWAVFTANEKNAAVDPAARRAILETLQPVYHNTHKIAGLDSIDSGAGTCTFCANMRKSNNPLLICKYCYDIKNEGLYPAVGPAHAYQVRAWSHVLFTVDEMRETLKFHKKAVAVRFNSSGDLENAVHAINYFRVAKAFPDINFALWSKNIQAVRAAAAAEGVPENLVLIYSVPEIDNTPAVPPAPFKYAFCVCSTTERVNAAVDTGANECNGKMCSECGYKCYFDTHSRGALIVEFLRASGAMKKAIDAEHARRGD